MGKNYWSYLIAIGLIFLATLSIAAHMQADLPINPDVLVISADNIASLQIIESFDQDTKHISISPNGQLFAIVTQHMDFDFNISIYNSETDEEFTTIQGRMDFFRDLVWSSDSKHIAVISGRRTGAGVEERSVKTYTIQHTDVSNPYLLGNSDVWYTEYVYPEDQPELPINIVWSPDNKFLVVAFHNRMAILHAESEEELFTADIAGIQTVDWTPDGSYIITQNSDSFIQIWGVPNIPN